jgi:hypothetical protein
MLYSGSEIVLSWFRYYTLISNTFVLCQTAYAPEVKPSIDGGNGRIPGSSGSDVRSQKTQIQLPPSHTLPRHSSPPYPRSIATAGVSESLTNIA